MACWFISTVTLCHKSERIASGIVFERSESVHGHRLLSSEVKIKVDEVKMGCVHPLYGYSIEKEGFTAWEIDCCI